MWIVRERIVGQPTLNDNLQTAQLRLKECLVLTALYHLFRKATKMRICPHCFRDLHVSQDVQRGEKKGVHLVCAHCGPELGIYGQLPQTMVGNGNVLPFLDIKK
jgi:hypothetical protein